MIFEPNNKAFKGGASGPLKARSPETPRETIKDKEDLKVISWRRQFRKTPEAALAVLLDRNTNLSSLSESEKNILAESVLARFLRREVSSPHLIFDLLGKIKPTDLELICRIKVAEINFAKENSWDKKIILKKIHALQQYSLKLPPQQLARYLSLAIIYDLERLTDIRLGNVAHLNTPLNVADFTPIVQAIHAAPKEVREQMQELYFSFLLKEQINRPAYPKLAAVVELAAAAFPESTLSQGARLLRTSCLSLTNFAGLNRVNKVVGGAVVPDIVDRRSMQGSLTAVRDAVSLPRTSRNEKILNQIIEPPIALSGFGLSYNFQFQDQAVSLREIIAANSTWSKDKDLLKRVVEFAFSSAGFSDKERIVAGKRAEELLIKSDLDRVIEPADLLDIKRRESSAQNYRIAGNLILSLLGGSAIVGSVLGKGPQHNNRSGRDSLTTNSGPSYEKLRIPSPAQVLGAESLGAEQVLNALATTSASEYAERYFKERATNKSPVFDGSNFRSLNFLSTFEHDSRVPDSRLLAPRMIPASIILHSELQQALGIRATNESVLDTMLTDRLHLRARNTAGYLLSTESEAAFSRMVKSLGSDPNRAKRANVAAAIEKIERLELDTENNPNRELWRNRVGFSQFFSAEQAAAILLTDQGISQQKVLVYGAGSGRDAAIVQYVARRLKIPVNVAAVDSGAYEDQYNYGLGSYFPVARGDTESLSEHMPDKLLLYAPNLALGGPDYVRTLFANFRGSSIHIVPYGLYREFRSSDLGGQNVLSRPIHDLFKEQYGRGFMLKSIVPSIYEAPLANPPSNSNLFLFILTRNTAGN